MQRGSRRRKNRVLYRAISAVAAAFVLMAGTTAVFRATGVLDFDGDVAPTSGVHIATSAPKVEYYDAAPRSYADAADDIATARHALLEADGAQDAAEDGAPLVAGRRRANAR